MKSLLFICFVCVLAEIQSTESQQSSNQENIQLIKNPEKIQNNQSMPNLSFKNGYFIMENIPPEMMNRENEDWIYEIFSIFGMEISKEDIMVEGNTMRVKVPSCCCKQK